MRPTISRSYNCRNRSKCRLFAGPGSFHERTGTLTISICPSNASTGLPIKTDLRSFWAAPANFKVRDLKNGNCRRFTIYEESDRIRGYYVIVWVVKSNDTLQAIYNALNCIGERAPLRGDFPFPFGLMGVTHPTGQTEPAVNGPVAH